MVEATVVQRGTTGLLFLCLELSRQLRIIPPPKRKTAKKSPIRGSCGGSVVRSAALVNPADTRSNRLWCLGWWVSKVVEQRIEVEQAALADGDRRNNTGVHQLANVPHLDRGLRINTFQLFQRLLWKSHFRIRHFSYPFQRIICCFEVCYHLFCGVTP